MTDRALVDRALVDRVTSTAAGGVPTVLIAGPSAERALQVLEVAAVELREKLGIEPAVELRAEEGEWRPTSWAQARGWLASRSDGLLGSTPDARAEELATVRLLRFLEDRQLALGDVDLVLTTRTFGPWHNARALDTPPTTAQRRRSRHLCRVQGPPPTSIIVYAKEDA